MNDNWNRAIIFLSLHNDKTDGGAKILIDFKEGLEPYEILVSTYITFQHICCPTVQLV